MTPVDAMGSMAAATLMASFTGPRVPSWLRQRVEEGLGSVCLYGSNRLATPDEVAVVSQELHEARSSVLLALDEEGGTVTRLEMARGSSVPGNAALGAVDDVDLTRRLAATLGRALVAAGIDLDLAPVADLNSDPRNPVIGVRSFGSAPDMVARHVAAFVEGLQGVGVAACAKHFPGHGATTVDSHLDLPVVDVSMEVLSRRELVPFRAAVEAGVVSVMLGHLRMPAVDEVPATISCRVITGLLRDELGFGGAVVTDALDMQGIGGPRDIPANVVRALAAGADLCCLGPDATDELVSACIDAILGAVRCGSLDEERLVEAAGWVAGITAGQAERTPLGDLDELATVGREAAERALHVAGPALAPVSRAHVVELRREPLIAEGVVPWGVAAALREHDPASTSTMVERLAEVPAALVAAQARPLVVVVRDPQSPGGNPEALPILDALLAARPEAVVVDMGWPDPDIDLPPNTTRILTYGSSRVSGEAVASVLATGSGALAPHPVARTSSARVVHASTGRNVRG